MKCFLIFNQVLSSSKYYYPRSFSFDRFVPSWSFSCCRKFIDNHLSRSCLSMLSTIRNWAWPLRPQLVVNGQSLEDQSGTYMALINSGLIFSTRRVFKDKRTGCKLFRPKLPNVYFSLLCFSGYFIIFRLLDDTEAWVVRQKEYFHFFCRRKPFPGDSSHSLTSRPSTVSKQKKMRF